MDIIDNLTNTKLQTLRYFELPEEKLIQTYGVGKWSIKQILVHLTDAESILLNRIRRVIAEPKQVIWAFDQDLWCENLDYHNFPLPLSKAAFTANRELIIYFAREHYKKSGHKEFIHSETGTRTLKDEFDKVASHCTDHLAQIEIALKKAGF